MLRYRTFGKRLGDLSLTVPALLLLAPVIGALCVVTRLSLGRPVFFRQSRAGWLGKPFELLKFRTMTDRRGPSGSLLPDELRLTRFGRWLRTSSLDELPTLVSVLRGDMSLVGPRPLLVEYLDRYSPRQARRHEVRPGITGWAQVNGRNTLSWPERFEMDVWYVDHMSLGLDVRIFLRTLGAVLRADGINAEGHATMPEFGGES